MKSDSIFECHKKLLRFVRQKALIVTIAGATGLAILAASPVSADTTAGRDLNVEAAEVEFWSSIKESENPAEFEAYLEQFPDGIFAPLARLRIEQLSSKAEEDEFPEQDQAEDPRDESDQIPEDGQKPDGGPKEEVPEDGQKPDGGPKDEVPEDGQKPDGGPKDEAPSDGLKPGDDKDSTPSEDSDSGVLQKRSGEQGETDAPTEEPEDTEDDDIQKVPSSTRRSDNDA